MIILMDVEKTFKRTQYPFVIKTLSTLGTKGPYLNIIKAIYDQFK